MNRRTVLLVTALVVLTVVNFLLPGEPSPATVSTFGKAGAGHGAVYDLLTEGDLARGRSFEAGVRLDDAGPVWWIDPLGVCDGRIARSGEVDILDESDVAWPVGEWVRGGRVAVVFLQSSGDDGPVASSQDELVICDAIAGIRLPLRTPLAADWESAESAEGAEGAQVEGPLVSEPRRIPTPTPYAFDEALDWAVTARVSHSGQTPRPFVLSRSLGDGLLVVVADSGFTHNRWLDALDSAPLVVDLVRSFGTPRFDEREHGFLPETSALRYIASSAALPVYVGLALLGALYAWRGNALPPRSVQEFDPARPTLETYVTSMAALYAGTRDHARVFERYRELTASRLRRHFALPQEVSPIALADRIERSRGREVGGRARCLHEDRRVATSSELEAAIRELDSLVRDVMEGNR